jgi:hypothetical protein
MQMLAAQGLIFGAHMGQQMNMMGMGGMGMGMGMPGMPGMGMPGMGMPGMMPMPMPNQNQNHPNNGNGGNVRPPPMRGGFRGGFRGRGAFPRGGGAGRVASTKRPAEDAAGGVEKMQRV